MRLLFFGSSPLAVPILDRLVHDPRFEVVLVVTRQDKPSGRRQELLSTEVAICAKEHSLPLFQPTSLKSEEIFLKFRSIDYDIGAVASYGMIIPQRIL